MKLKEFLVYGMLAAFNADRVILAAIEELREWVDNRPTDKITGRRYTVVAPAKDWMTVQVTIDGDTSPLMAQEDLHQLNEAVKPVFVRFDGLTGKVWQDRDKNLQLTCTAKSIEIANKKGETTT